jgi:hypothetical protein
MRELTKKVLAGVIAGLGATLIVAAHPRSPRA